MPFNSETNNSARINSDAHFSPSADLFAHCWRLNSCASCLDTPHPCGWCPTSSACVPAPRGLLTPLTSPSICPSSSERFELRTKPLNCNVSTLTALTCVASVLGTLLVVGVVWGVVRWWRKRWEGRGVTQWRGEGTVDERSSLLQREPTGGRRWSYWVYNTAPSGRPGVARSETSGEEAETVGGGGGFEERRRRMLGRRVNEV